MFFIFLADPVPCIVWTFCAMFGWQDSWFGLQFEHISGNGLRFNDCIWIVDVKGGRRCQRLRHNCRILGSVW
jgi:hypothetical protein